MKTIAMIILLIYQLAFAIMLNKTKDKDLRKQILLIVQLIPLAMCIILAM